MINVTLKRLLKIIMIFYISKISGISTPDICEVAFSLYEIYYRFGKGNLLLVLQGRSTIFSSKWKVFPL